MVWGAIKNAVGLGPTEAKTNRQQRLQRFSGKGMLLGNETTVDGVPGADAFKVMDRWLIETVNDGQSVQLSASFEIVFTKRSLFRSIIEKSIKKETREWWNGYHEMLTNALTTNQPRETVSNHVPVLDTTIVDHLSRMETLAYSTNTLLKIVTVVLVAIFLMQVALFVLLYQEMTAMRGPSTTQPGECALTTDL